MYSHLYLSRPFTLQNATYLYAYHDICYVQESILSEQGVFCLSKLETLKPMCADFLQHVFTFSVCEFENSKVPK